jgi:uncharacterized protein
MTSFRSVLVLALAMSLAPACAHGDALPRRGSLGAAVALSGGAVVITRVLPDSAALSAGLQTGDAIVSVDGKPIATVAAFLTAMRRPAGSAVVLTVARSGSDVTKSIVLSAAAKETDPAVATIYDSIAVDGSLRRVLLTLPLGASGRLPAVLFAGGIGCYSIDNAFDVAEPYRNLAHDLSRRGFVTLRVEKSGIGDSSGPPCSTVDFATEYDGYASALAALRDDPHVDPARIFIFGHSIGGLIAPRLALGGGVAGVVVADTVGIDWFTYEMINERRQAVLAGMDPAHVDADAATKEFCMHEVLIAKKTSVAASSENRDCRVPAYPASDAYMQQVAALDIAEPWQKIEVPVLAIYGKSDFITSQDDHQRIVAIVNASHPGTASLVTVADMDHYLAVSPTQAASFARATGGHQEGVYDTGLSAAVTGWLCAHAPCASQSATVPFTFVDNRMMVECTVNGKGPFVFAVDTGSPVIAITPEVARAAGVSSGSSSQIGGAGNGTVAAGEGRLASIALGSLSFSNMDANIIDLSEIRTKLGFPHFDGIVGYPILKQFAVFVNVDAGTMAFDAAVPSVPPAAVSTAFSGVLPRIAARVDGVATTVVVDTGDRSSMTLFGPFARAHGYYERPAIAHNIVTGYGIGGPVYGDVFTLSHLDVLGAKLTAIAARASRQTGGIFATSTSDAGSIGEGVLKRFNIVYDYPHGRMIAWPSRYYSVPDRFVPPHA